MASNTDLSSHERQVLITTMFVLEPILYLLGMESCYVAQAGLDLTAILLPEPPSAEIIGVYRLSKA